MVRFARASIHEQCLGLEAAHFEAIRNRPDRARDIALSRTAGIDAALSMHDCDVLIAPMGAAAKTTGKAGAPVVAIPCGLDKAGVPFGITVFAGIGSDARLLAVAGAIERAVGDRRLPKV